MVHIYAEHLRHIHALSIQITLDTLSNNSTSARITAEGSLLQISHNGENSDLFTLPATIPSIQDISLTIPSSPTTDLRFRFPLKSCISTQQDDGNITPWSAASLTPLTSIYCRACSSQIILPDRITTWKDLPSEGWAEMMDFWHCHKPHTPNDHNEASSMKRGYAAASKLALESGVGMVDALHFLFTPQDCRNVESVTSESDDDTTLLRCTSCKATLGHIEPTTQAYRLHKLSLSVSIDLDRSPQSHDPQNWFACLLLSAAESKGVRKFAIPDQDKTLKLWIFTPDLTIASSTLSSERRIRVVKVLWQEVDTSTLDEHQRLTTASLAEEELHLSDHETEILYKILQTSIDLLPPISRTFQDWKVGLLQRFTTSDLSVPHR